MYKIGAGYNKFFDIKNNILKIPELVSFIEIGIEEIQDLPSENSLIGKEVSLHLARAPLVEDLSVQLEYISFLQEILKISKLKNLNITSIGIHLSGSRQTNVGKLGIADIYIPTKNNLERIYEFLRQIKKLNLPIWFENASFYSKDKKSLIKTWQHINKICLDNNCKMVIDIGHILIESNNVGLKPEIILGMIDWDRVAEIHLSGIKSNIDGCMHDSHNLPVHEKVWDLLGSTLDLVNKNNIIFTIEHTSPNWVDNRNEFLNDFLELEIYLNKEKEEISFNDKSFGYTVGYLKYMVKTSIPLLDKACHQRKISLDSIFIEWIDKNINFGKRVVFSKKELPLSERNNSVELFEDFLKYAKSILINLDENKND